MSGLSYLESPKAEPQRDGLLVRLTANQLSEANTRPLTAALHDLASQNAGPLLYLDFGTVEHLSRPALLRLSALDWKLQEMGNRLVLLNVKPSVYALCQANRLTEVLEVRGGESAA